MAERDQRWDIFKGFAVFLVVLGHLTDDNTVLETLIYTVHMPIFFIVSVYFAWYSFEKNTVKDNIIKKTKTLFLPWITWSALAVIMNCIREFLVNGVNVSFFIDKFKNVYCTSMSVWFLFVLYIIFILFGVSKAFEESIKNKCVGLLLFVGIVLLIPSLDIFEFRKIKINAFWFLLGYLLHFISVKQCIKKVFFKSGILFIPLYFCVFRLISVNEFFSFYTLHFEFMSIGRGFFVSLVSIFYCILGLAFVWGYIVEFCTYMRMDRLSFSAIGKVTMEIYTIHMMFVSYIVFVPDAVRQSHLFCNYIYMPVYAILICLVIKIIVEKILHKIKLYNVLMLGKF